MKIKRFLHVETDINGYNTVDVFATVEASREYAKEKLVEAVRTLLGSDYVIPDKDIDRDGYISHFPMGMKKPEISSSEWAWSVFDGDDQVVRGSVEEIEIELTEQETLDLYFAMEDSFRAEDAKHALFEYLGYQENPDEGSYWDAKDQIVEEAFFKRFGIAIQEAVIPTSKFYMLETLVKLFQKRQDANLDEWSVWEQVVKDVLAEREAEYQKEGMSAGRCWHAVSHDGQKWEKRWISCLEAEEERQSGKLAVRINSEEEKDSNGQ